MSKNASSAGGDTSSQSEAKQMNDEMNGAFRDGESLEDLLTTLQSQIKSSDWLQKNTAEKWEAENPALAQEYKAAMKAKAENADCMDKP